MESFIQDKTNQLSFGIKEENVLYQKYLDLDPSLQSVLHFIALSGQSSMDITKLRDCLKDANVKTNNNKVYNTPALKQSLSLLQSYQLIDENNICNVSVIHFITQDAIESKMKDRYLLNISNIFSLQKLYKNFEYYNLREFSPRMYIALRILVYINNQKEFIQLLNVERSSHLTEELKIIFSTFCDFILKTVRTDSWFVSRFEVFQDYLLTIQYSDFLQKGKINPDFVKYISYYKEEIKAGKFQSIAFIFTKIELMKNGIESEAAMDSFFQNSNQPIPQKTLYGIYYFLHNSIKKSIDCFNISLASIKKETRKRKIFFKNEEAIFGLLAFIKEGNHTMIKKEI